MHTHRKTALAAGLLYLLTFVSIPTLVLYIPVHAPNYILSGGPDTPVIIGVILELIVALAGIGTAAALYPVLKKQNQGMAIGLVGARVLEASTIFAGAMFLLTVLTLRQTGAGEGALLTSHTLVTMYDRIFLIGQSTMPGINDMLLGLLLFKSRLVPRGLALIGIIGAVVLIMGDLAVLFGLVGQHAPIAGLSAIFVALFEFSLGWWLVIKGFNKKAITTLFEKKEK